MIYYIIAKAYAFCLKEDGELTKLLKFDTEQNFEENTKIAGEILKNGGLVAIPTETVYGLGANAFDENAVKNIFKAKGRPSDNPLIVHVSDIEMVEKIVLNIPDKAKKLMDAFWPGPISIIMKKSSMIPDVVSAGLDTVAVRMPEHPIASSVIKESGVPVAAPSANTSGRPSPTEAKHVLFDMDGKIDAVCDGGKCRVGIESTVIDMTSEVPVILRPGEITANMIEKVIEQVKFSKAKIEDGDTPKCPGMKYEHYSPKADVYVIECTKDASKEQIVELAEIYGRERTGILDCGIFSEETFSFEYIDGGATSEKYAAELFSSLREFDQRECKTVFALICFDDELSDSVRNRLYKSAGNKIIKTGEGK